MMKPSLLNVLRETNLALGKPSRPFVERQQAEGIEERFNSSSSLYQDANKLYGSTPAFTRSRNDGGEKINRKYHQQHYSLQYIGTPRTKRDHDGE